MIFYLKKNYILLNEMLECVEPFFPLKFVVGDISALRGSIGRKIAKIIECTMPYVKGTEDFSSRVSAYKSGYLEGKEVN